jgi:hypothetical protein
LNSHPKLPTGSLPNHQKKLNNFLDLVLPHFAEVALLIYWIAHVGQRIFLFPIPKSRIRELVIEVKVN